MALSSVRNFITTCPQHAHFCLLAQHRYSCGARHGAPQPAQAVSRAVHSQSEAVQVPLHTSTVICRDIPRHRKAVGHRDASMGKTEGPREKYLPWHVEPN